MHVSKAVVYVAKREKIIFWNMIKPFKTIFFSFKPYYLTITGILKRQGVLENDISVA